MKNRPVPAYSLGAIAKRGKLFPILCALALGISACGGGGGGSSSTPPPPPPPPSSFTIGGTVINLAGSNGGLQVEDNGDDTLAVNANGTFTFKMSVAGGSAYDVTVSAQPTSPAQKCEVTNGTGTATANVTNVQVDCGHGEWTWVGGSNIANQKGIYGTLGTPAATNIPGGRGYPADWTDKSGNFWLFAGAGYDSAGTNDSLNDLWEYSNGKWAWVGGSDLVDEAGIYGTKGTPSPTNIPGARCCSTEWTDASGNLWLLGGNNTNATGGGYFNDLWEYSNDEWAWITGANVLDQSGVYGTLGTPSASNTPGARSWPMSWTDASGNFWLFGGDGYDSTGTFGVLNDLWKYNTGDWTWMGGSNIANQKGIYGALGTPSASNAPGARVSAMTWVDASGNLWLFGGSGYDSAGTAGVLNDLWKYSNGEWTWMGGSSVANQKGIYGTLGTPSATNIPGARYGAVVWTDSSGNLWLFGGNGYDSAGTNDLLNDLWKYSNGQWTWMGGSNLAKQAGTYGILGTPNPSNIPGGRRYTAVWIDAQGNLWLFGGHGYDSAGTVGQLNDLWKYEP